MIFQRDQLEQRGEKVQLDPFDFLVKHRRAAGMRRNDRRDAGDLVTAQHSCGLTRIQASPGNPDEVHFLAAGLL